MSKLLVKIRFIGSRYVGWQVQKNGLSIQQSVQDAVEKVYGKRVDITGCSRTDSGVHANCYCLCFTPPCEVEPSRVAASLNSALPEDIAAYMCTPVPDDFHPRYSAVAKEYIYRLYDGYHRNPFLNGIAYHYRRKINYQLINDACKSFVGTHDFRSFMSNGSKITDTVRTLYFCGISDMGDYAEIRVCGDGFLYNMVRIIVGTLLSVNEQRIDKSTISDIILARDRKKAGKTVPAHGLYLNRVFYDKKEVRRNYE